MLPHIPTRPAMSPWVGQPAYVGHAAYGAVACSQAASESVGVGDPRVRVSRDVAVVGWRLGRGSGSVLLVRIEITYAFRLI
jgi:hypothetical protein